MWVIDINSGAQDLWSKERSERMRKRESQRKRRRLVGRKRKHDVRGDVKAWFRSYKEINHNYKLYGKKRSMCNS